MNSIEMNTQEHEQSGPAASLVPLRSGLSQKRWIACTLAMASSIAVAVFVVGRESVNATCTDEFPSVEADLGAGLSTITEWFPAKATLLLAHKDEIIHHIMNGTEPDSNSLLRKQMLIIPVDNQSSTISKGLALLEDDAQPIVLAAASTCQEAISRFFADLAGFLAGLLAFHLDPPSPKTKKKWYKAIVLWLQNTASADNIQAFVKQIDNIVHAKGPKEMAQRIWQAVRAAIARGGSWLKRVFFSIVNLLRGKNWQALKTVVKMAAEVTVMFGKKEATFLIAATLPLLSNQSFLSSGREVWKSCRKPLPMEYSTAGSEAAAKMEEEASVEAMPVAMLVAAEAKVAKATSAEDPQAASAAEEVVE